LEVEDLGLAKTFGSDTPEKTTDEIVFPPLPAQGIDLVSTQESLEKYYIGEALKMSEGNESKAAKLLNMNHHTFRYRKKKLQKK
jgi:transcriptional regulator with PAS, ATPase and Fis domain